MRISRGSRLIQLLHKSSRWLFQVVKRGCASFQRRLRRCPYAPFHPFGKKRTSTGMSRLYVYPGSCGLWQLLEGVLGSGRGVCRLVPMVPFYRAVVKELNTFHSRRDLETMK